MPDKDAELERRLFDDTVSHTDLERFAARRIRELHHQVSATQLATIDAWSDLVWRTLTPFINGPRDLSTIDRLYEAMASAFAQGVKFDEPWKCCEIPVMRFISGGRSSGHDRVLPTSEHVGVCDGCGAFTVLASVGDTHVRVRFTLWHPNALIAAGRALEQQRQEEPRSPLAELTVKSTRAIRQAANDVKSTLEAIRKRGGPGLVDITAADIAKIYSACELIVTSIPEKVQAS